MRKRTVSLIVGSAASALVLAACASATTAMPGAGPGGLTIQGINAPKVDLSFLSVFQTPESMTVTLPARSVRGEDEATPALANMIIAKAQAAQQAKAAVQMSVRPAMQLQHHCQGMDMED